MADHPPGQQAYQRPGDTEEEPDTVGPAGDNRFKARRFTLIDPEPDGRTQMNRYRIGWERISRQESLKNESQARDHPPQGFRIFTGRRHRSFPAPSGS